MSSTMQWRIGVWSVVAGIAIFALFPGEVLSVPHALDAKYRHWRMVIENPVIADGAWYGTFRIQVEDRASGAAIGGATVTLETHGRPYGGTDALGSWVTDASGLADFPLRFGTSFVGNRWGMKPSYQLAVRVEAPGYVTREIDESIHLKNSSVFVAVKLRR